MKKGSITSSQWAAIHALSLILEGPFKVFRFTDIGKLKPDWMDAAQPKIKLWELLTKKIHIESRIVEEISYSFLNIAKCKDSAGVQTRKAIIGVILIEKHGANLPKEADHIIWLKIQMDMINEGDEWHVNKITFIPYDDQRNTLFKDYPLEYSFV